MKQQIVNITLTAMFAFITVIDCFAQETMSREQEREIKISGKYYFGECSAFDEVDAKECALRELTQAVLVTVLQESIKSEKPAELQKNMEMRANTARLPQTGKIKILAWIAKDSIYVTKTEPQQTVTPVPEPAKPEQANGNSSRSDIADPVVKDLADAGDYTQFVRKADSWKRQGKLIYGSRKTSFIRPDNCHIAVFSSSRTLIALLGEGNTSRKDLLTGKTIQNPEQHYSNDNLVWIQIN